MAATQLIAARVSSETKSRFRAIAEQQQVTESALLKRMVELTLRSVAAGTGELPQAAHRGARDSRLCIRLRAEDQLLLRERAVERQMPVATYASVMVRAHLRHLKPLPKAELVALKRSVAELAAIGRNINQIALAANRGDRVTGPAREDIKAILRICEGLRDHVKILLRANIKSWEQGYPEPHD